MSDNAWKKNLRQVVPYTPGEQPKEKNIIKLNTNENPYPPAPGVEKVLKGFDTALLRKYPDPAVTDLRDAIADAYGVDRENVFVGVGSDDVLAMSFLTFFNGEDKVLFPDITYSFYDVWADTFRIPYETVPLDDDFRIQKYDYYGKNGGIVIANPNAPTGIAESREFFKDILNHNRDSVVIVDEAYVDFGGESCLPLINEYDNLLVVQTFSKSRSMAGSRIGFAFGSKELIKALSDVKYSINSYTMDSVTIAAGYEAVKDRAYFKSCCDKVISTRERMKTELSALGFSFHDSKTNFVFAKHEKVPAEKIFNALKQKGIYVRYFNKPRIDEYLRISVGTDEETDELIKALKEIVS
ncbi:MAG: histidinol-phosphate transaminase [Lachnospiraceae bacterium]|nr:histidinol-phosphate transaminase [Lachnospiraceae bacterium]